jgi:hypothetical protein
MRLMLLVLPLLLLLGAVSWFRHPRRWTLRQPPWPVRSLVRAEA